MSTAASKSKPILIVLIAGIGDMVLASKAIRALRRGHPGSRIHLLTSTEAAPLARSCPYLDRVHSFPIRELRTDKGSLLEMVKIAMNLRQTAFGVILNLYRVSSRAGAFKMGILFSLLRGDRKIGHDRYGFGRFLSEGVSAGTFTGRHVAEAMLEIARQAGGLPDGEGIEVFWNADIPLKWEGLFDPFQGRPIVGIHPGGDRANRRWAQDRFASVAEAMVGRYNAAVVLVGGRAEVPIAARIAARIGLGLLDLTGKTPVEALPYLVSRMDLLITNDSGPMHVAAATKTPLVALFGPEDPGLFGPYTDPGLYRVLHKDLSCRPCRDDERCPSPSCLDLITVDEVLTACRDLLHRRT